MIFERVGIAMYSVKDLAYELDVTVQTVYNHIKKNDKKLIGHIFKKQGTSYLDDEGLKIIKISMGLIEVPEVKKDIGAEEIIRDISIQVSNNIKKDMEKLQQEVQDLKEQNRILIEMLQKQQEKKSIFDLFKRK